jgi:hypothetical protein
MYVNHIRLYPIYLYCWYLSIHMFLMDMMRNRTDLLNSNANDIFGIYMYYPNMSVPEISDSNTLASHVLLA